MTHSRKLAIGGILRVVNVFAAAIISFLVMPYLVRSFDDRLYGIWTMTGAVVGYYSLLDLGLSSAVGRYLSRAIGAGDQEAWRRVFGTSLRLFAIIGLVILAIAALVAWMLPLFVPARDVSLFRILILVLSTQVALNFPTRVFSGALEAALRYDLTCSFDLLAILLRPALMVLAVQSGSDLSGLAWASLLGGLPSMCLNIWAAGRTLPYARLSFRFAEWAQSRILFSYSVYTLVVRIADMFRFQVASIVVAGVAGFAAVTHYRIAGMMAQYFIDVIVSAVGVVQPVLSQQDGRGDFAALKRTFFFGSKIAISLSGFAAFGLIAWGHPFIERWMGPQYLDAYPCLVLLVIGSAAALSQTVGVNLLFATSQHRYHALLTTIEGATNLLLSIWLGRKFGMYGVALGSCIPMTFLKLVMQPVYVCRATGIHLGEYYALMLRTLSRVVISLLLPGAFTYLLVRPTYPALLLTGFLSAVSYAAIQWFTLFTAEERSTFLEKILHRKPATPVPAS